MTLQKIMWVCDTILEGSMPESDAPKEFWENVYCLARDMTNQDWRERQQPKKPIKGEHGFYECPTCHKPTVDDDFDYFNYCYNCGQKIDWSEV